MKEATHDFVDWLIYFQCGLLIQWRRSLIHNYELASVLYRDSREVVAWGHFEGAAQNQKDIRLLCMHGTQYQQCPIKGLPKAHYGVVELGTAIRILAETASLVRERIRLVSRDEIPPIDSVADIALLLVDVAVYLGDPVLRNATSLVQTVYVLRDNKLENGALLETFIENAIWRQVRRTTELVVHQLEQGHVGHGWNARQLHAILTAVARYRYILNPIKHLTVANTVITSVCVGIEISSLLE